MKRLSRDFSRARALVLPRVTLARMHTRMQHASARDEIAHLSCALDQALEPDGVVADVDAECDRLRSPSLCSLAHSGNQWRSRK